MTFDQSSSSNIGMLPGSVFQILRIKAKMRESRRGGGGGGGGRRTNAERREGEEPDQNTVPLFDLLFSCLSYCNLYGSSKHDVLFIDYELTL